MNERLKELLEQATEVHDYWYRGESQHMVNHKMFAELIIRECAELSVNSQYADTKSEYYEGFNEALIYVGNKIKTHFGVEL